MTVAVLLSAGLSAGSSNAAEDSNFPGLPKLDSGTWGAPRATGLNYTKQAQQWVRLPPLVAAAHSRAVVTRTDNGCQLLLPYRRTELYSAPLFLRSSKGARRPYGYVGPFTVRTVAFGSIPVEASIELRQPRDGEDLPVPLEVKQMSGVFCPGESPFPDVPLQPDANKYLAPAEVDGQLEVAVTELKVDGVDLKLADDCRTSEPGKISLTSRELYALDPDVPAEDRPDDERKLLTTPYFSLGNGGLLTGTVAIPAFTGCATRGGEDISRLLTATISGSDNPVEMRSEGLRNTVCLEPGAQCPPLPDLPFPTGN